MAINQASNGAGAGGMIAAMMTIRLGDGLETAQAVDTMLDENAKMGKETVEDDVGIRAGFAARFATGCKAVVLVAAEFDIGQVASLTNMGGQALQQTAVFQQLDVGYRAIHTVGHIDHVARVEIHRHLRLEGMLLLLARVVGFCLVSILWAPPIVLRLSHQLNDVGSLEPLEAIC